MYVCLMDVCGCGCAYTYLVRTCLHICIHTFTHLYKTIGLVSLSKPNMGYTAIIQTIVLYNATDRTFMYICLTDVCLCVHINILYMHMHRNMHTYIHILMYADVFVFHVLIKRSLKPYVFYFAPSVMSYYQ